MGEITLDQAAALSPWPKRLLDEPERWRRRKTPEEIEREYGREKWGLLLERYRAARDRRPANASLLDHVRGIECDLGGPSSGALTWREGKILQESDVNRSLDYARDLILEAIRGDMGADGALIELGSGYGAMLLRLALATGCRRIVAAEVTDAGLALCRLLAEDLGIAAGLSSLRYDFTRPAAIDPDLLKDAAVFTSFALGCVPVLSDEWLDALVRGGVRVCVHLEPAYERIPGDTRIGLLQRRYIEVNDYNRNLFSLLDVAHRAGRIVLDPVRPHVVGSNFLTPLSLFRWRPGPAAGGSGRRE